MTSRTFLFSLLSVCSALTVATQAADKPAAQFVRISLSGNDRVLTLAEVEVVSGGKNIAPTGKASQSTVGAGGVPERAIDGNKDSDYNKNGQTHTLEGGDKAPWWELNLNSAQPIESIQIWNRAGFAARLKGFKLELLDSARKPVFARDNNPGPDGSIKFTFAGKTEITMASHSGKPLPVPLMPADVPAGYRDPATFAFVKGDVVATIGNGLADREQHDGWTETYLQVAQPDKALTFRNLSHTGDRPGHYPRNSGFTPMPDYLRHVKASVIFAFFGYNESFAGSSGLAAYEKKLIEMIRDLRATQPDGKTFPRIVLFSPIAHENFGDPNLSDGVENNKRLALYSAVMQKVAGQEGITFVNLFEPTKALYESNDKPLTINGIHLNEFGNRLVGKVIAEALTGAPIKAADAQLAKVREAVIDKNWHWHNRYRATDGNDIWGGRSTLTFVNNQSNAEVLMHELTMLDIMTANRDVKVRARANGGDAKVDDSNVPPPIPVISNVGGGSQSSSAEKEGNTNYLTAEHSMAKMTLAKGFKANIYADESRFPEIANPVQMQVDGKGRLWVAAWKTYPKWEPLKKMDDSLVILHDDNKDGVADRSTIFAHVHNPLGFEFWNGGVIVTSQPDILFLRDTNGDDVADERYVLFQGTDSADTHHAANNLIYGPDGGIYWQSGVFMQHNHEHPWGPSLEASASAMYRFDPRRYTIAFHAPNSPNPHGTAFDGWGYHYANDGTGGQSFQVVPNDKGFTMRQLLVKEVRPVPADEIVSSTNFPDEMQGNFLVCNTIGFLGIKQYKLHREGYTEGGKNFKFGEVWGTPTEEMLNSSDKNFRPTDAIFGEDGALYVADWQNVIIGHMQHNIRDPQRDKTHGRVYRIVNASRPLQKPVAIDGQPIAALLKNFAHPTVGVRHRTRVELSERKTDDVMAEAKKWISTLDPKKKEDAQQLLEALWLHQQHNVRNRELLDLVLNSPEPHAALAAKTVKHHWDVADPVKNVVTGPIAQVEEKVDVKVPAHFTKDEAEVYKLGSAVFHREAHCVTCHQNTGLGMLNIYPPLVNSPWVSGNDERLIKLTLHGLWGPMEVNGVTYDPSKGVPPMTAFKAVLNDKEIAAVLTYVRNTWGNKAPVVSPEKVKAVREATKDTQMFIKPQDLLKEYPLEK